MQKRQLNNQPYASATTTAQPYISTTFGPPYVCLATGLPYVSTSSLEFTQKYQSQPTIKRKIQLSKQVLEVIEQGEYVLLNE